MGHVTVRATTLLNKLLNLPGIGVRRVSLPVGRAAPMVVDVALRAQRLACPLCEFTTRARYDTRREASWWRHLDFGTAPVIVRAWLRRLSCPVHGVVVQAAPFARHRTRFTRDFEDVAAFLATKTDKTTTARFPRVDWDTAGRIRERVVDGELDPERLTGLADIGVDEIWRTRHKYLTLVTDHVAGKVAWGRAGKDAATLDGFFTEIGDEPAKALRTVSMDMGSAFNKSVREHAPQTTIAIDPFHAVKLVTEALDAVRRTVWKNYAPSTRARPARSKAPGGHC